MSKTNLSAQDRISAVMQYREGNISQRKLAEQFNVSLASVQQWIRNYESMGEDTFLESGRKSYSKELKVQAVQDYLTGQGSLNDICKKYGIRAISKLGEWIKKYNSHEELKASGTGGTVTMTKEEKPHLKNELKLLHTAFHMIIITLRQLKIFQFLINRLETIPSNTKKMVSMHYKIIEGNVSQKILLLKLKNFVLN